MRTTLLWVLERVGIPLVIVIVSLIVKDCWDDYHKPELATKYGDVVVTEEGARYRVESPFVIRNSGHARANKHKVTVQAEEAIEDIVIAPEYLGKMECYLGGKKHKYVCYSITLDEGKEVHGKIVFYNTSGWPERGIKPIRIYY